MTHGATKLDSAFAQYQDKANEYHATTTRIAKLVENLRMDNHSKTAEDLQEISQHQDNLAYFRQLYRATVRKMDLVRRLIVLEEEHPTSAFL